MGLREELKKRKIKKEVEKLWKQKLKEMPIGFYDAKSIGLLQPKESY